MNVTPVALFSCIVAWISLLGLSEPKIAAQPLKINSIQVTNNLVQFQVQGSNFLYYRVDVATDLTNWLPVDLFFNFNGSHTTTDTFNPTNKAQFYRALQVDPTVQVMDVSPLLGVAGAQVQIVGQFLPSAGQYAVKFGGVPANIVSSTSTRLTVTLPSNAMTSRISVSAPNGAAVSDFVFVVLSNAIVRFTPPIGMAATNFTIVNNYGTGVLLSNTLSDYSLPVRLGPPALTYAANPSQTNLFFSAVSLGANQIIPLNADSTAQALVFQNPNLFTSDGDLAASILAMIQTNAGVRTFSQTLSNAMIRTSAPLEDSAVTNAYINAVASVLNSESATALAATMKTRHPMASTPLQALSASPFSTEIYQIENPLTRFLTVEGKGLKFKTESTSFEYNPVDWIVVYEDIDVDAAFPGGLEEFTKVQQSWETTPEEYPSKDSFSQERSVEANLVSSRLNIVDYLSKQLAKLFVPAVDNSVAIPSGNGMYLVRGVGPSFLPPEDFNFVSQHMQGIYVRIMAMNLVKGALALASGLIEDDEAKKEFEALADKSSGLEGNESKAALDLVSETALISAEADQDALTVHSQADFQRIACNLAAELAKLFLAELIKKPAEAALKLAGKTVFSVVDKLNKVSALGQVAERASGLFRTTTLETSFIEVGDPFSLGIISVVPPAAAPGQDIVINFKGSPTLKQFDPNDPGSVVTFEGPFNPFDGQVTSVTGPDAEGVQTLNVRIPGSLGSGNNGLFTMYVKTQGRKGSTNFLVSTSAALASVFPLEGFPPWADWMGSPYPGTPVRLQGALFNTKDTFLFAGGGNGVPANNVHANNGQSAGDVTVAIPIGAATGPLQILHQLTNGAALTITGPVFTVWGPPAILSVQPPNGTGAGNLIQVTARQVGHDASLIQAQFTGIAPETVNILPDGTLNVFVPINAQSGSLTILTPAGSSQVPYEVFPPAPITNLAPGVTITVGGTSIIGIDRAIAFANGIAFPTEAEGESGISPWDTNNLAATPIGPRFSNVISVQGTLDRDVDFNVNNDIITGVFSGNVTVSGNHNNLSGTFLHPLSVVGSYDILNGVIHGSISLGGVSNTISGNFNQPFTEPITVTGTNNSLSGMFTAPVVVYGDYNSFTHFPVFSGIQTNALTIYGNHNSGTINFTNNTGDGLRIIGGKFNQISLNSSMGNGGNGATLTGGAEGNTLFAGIGTLGYPGNPGSGNGGHGVALIGNAVGNVISGNINGNGVDGIYLEGAGVVSNTFNANVSANGRNGMTLTNGPSMNVVGVWPADTPPAKAFVTVNSFDYNAGSGVVCAGCGPNLLGILAQSNTLYGVLFSNVKVPPSSFIIRAFTTAFGGAGNPAGNGRAGLRLEKGTSGLNVTADLANDLNGLEMDGADVTNNVVFCNSSNARGHGAFVSGVHDNDITLEYLIGNKGDGALIQGASNNIFHVYYATSNSASGFHFTGGSYGNQLVSGFGAPFTASAELNGLAGCRLELGSHHNRIELLTCVSNRQDGLVFSGAGVTGNEFVRSSASGNLRDGIRIEQGATNNFIGSDDEGAASEITVAGNGVAGIHITDSGTSGGMIRRCMIGGPGSFGAPGGHPYGVLVENQAAVGQLTRSTILLNTNGVVLQSGAHDGILNNLILSQNTNAAISLQNAYNILIGGQNPLDHNEINQNTTGIEISGPMATNNLIINNHINLSTDALYIHGGASQTVLALTNLIENNFRGVRIESATSNLLSQATIENNHSAGVTLALGATGNLIRGNIISNNVAGVVVTGAGTIANTISGNSITADSTLGIQLSNGGNTELTPPVLKYYAGMRVGGDTEAPDGSRVEIFRDPAGEGQTFLGGGAVLGGHFNVDLDTDPTAQGLVFELNGTVTDPNGNTSQFGGLTEQNTSPLGPLAFVQTATNGHGQIYFSTNGLTAVNLSQPTNDDLSPSLPRGTSCRKMAFARWVGTNTQLFVMDTATNASPQQIVIPPVTTTGFHNYDPDWLIPCQTLVFVSQRDGNSQIYSVNLDGSNLRRLTTNTVSDFSPAATSDGSRIVFVSDRSGANALWLMNADGSNQHALGSLPFTPTRPSVSPDGGWVAISMATFNAVTEIAVLRIDGTGFSQITSDGRQASHPTWLRGGEQIVFSSNRGGPVRLFSISRSGANLQPLPFFGSSPSAGGQ